MRLRQTAVLVASLVGISMYDSEPERPVPEPAPPVSAPVTTWPPALAPVAATAPAGSAPAPAALGQGYFVDCHTGDDANPGTAPTAAWRTLAPVQHRPFAPGDVVSLARGCAWDGGLAIDASGTPEAPVTFSAYGDGARPTVTNVAGGDWVAAIEVTGDHVVIEGLVVRDAHEAGVRLREGAQGNVVRDVEATATGIGFQVLGPGNIVAHNYAHDLRMVVDTPGGDDDYGAVGFWIGAPDNQVAYNLGTANRAPSADYGSDGGFAEIHGNGDRTWLHHNWAEGNNGFLEVGAGEAGGSARGVRVAQNVGFANGSVLCLHTGGTYGVAVEDFRVENNTFVEPGGTMMLPCMTGPPGPGALLLRNNIFATPAPIAASGDFDHVHNLFGSPAPGFPLGVGDRVGDPAFVNAAAKDFRLQAGSAAIDAGVDIGLRSDFVGGPIPLGAAPDIGAFESG